MRILIFKDSGDVEVKNRGDGIECRCRHGSNQSVSSLIPSEMTSYPLNLAEPYAFVRLDSDKPDNLHPDGNYHETVICSIVHLRLFTVWCKNS